MKEQALATVEGLVDSLVFASYQGIARDVDYTVFLAFRGVNLFFPNQCSFPDLMFSSTGEVVT